MRVQGFPDSFSLFSSALGNLFTMIGNAVPPPLAYQLGFEVQASHRVTLKKMSERIPMDLSWRADALLKVEADVPLEEDMVVDEILEEDGLLEPVVEVEEITAAPAPAVARRTRLSGAVVGPVKRDRKYFLPPDPPPLRKKQRA